jgi:hypothetical protein
LHPNLGKYNALEDMVEVRTSPRCGYYGTSLEQREICTQTLQDLSDFQESGDLGGLKLRFVRTGKKCTCLHCVEVTSLMWM